MVLLIINNSGLSTYEDEAALMGKDCLELFDQQVREIEERKEKDLPPPLWVLQAMKMESQQQGRKEAA